MTTDRAPTLRVAIDGGPLLGALTGVGVATREMLAALEKRGDVSIAPYACSFRGHLLPGMTRLPLPAAIAQRAWSRGQWPRMDHWLSGAHVVHGTNYVVPPSHAARLVTVYDCWFLRHPEHAGPAVTRAGAVLRRAVAAGATVHASSQATADAVRELLSTDRVEVIALAAPPVTDVAAPVVPPIAELDRAPFILALSTLERRKNLPRLIAAFAGVAAAAADISLVLAGAGGDDSDAINVAIDALPASARARVVMTDRVSAPVKEWLLANATALAYPSLDEGFGFPLLEAMQHDLPIVASTAGSIPEVAGDAAELVDAGDAAAIAAALITVIQDSRRRAELITAGRARLATMSWEHTAAQLALLYHRLHEENSR